MGIKKYEFTDETIEIDGHVLHRIRAVRDFTLNDYTHIKAGDLGGFVESENNLSHELRCWVSGDAHVYDNARVAYDALVSDNARVFDNAHVSGSSQVYGNACVFGEASVLGYTRVTGDAQIYDKAFIYGHSQVSGNACVFGDVYMLGNARLSGDAYIRSDDDYCLIQGFGPENNPTTFYNTSREDGKYEISVVCRCFEGTLAEFEAKMKESRGDNKYAKEYLKFMAILHCTDHN